MLTMPIKEKWFQLILQGIKKEEYREIKPYYNSRILNRMPEFQDLFSLQTALREETKDFGTVCFRNGYSDSSPEMYADCGVRIGKGQECWGAEPDKEYYIFEIRDIVWNSLTQKKGYLTKQEGI